MSATVRPVTRADVAEVVAMVHDLAEYERLPHECHLTADQLEAALFADHPALFGFVAETEPGADGAGAGGTQLDGFALWFLNYSTWEGVHGIHLEDLYVRPERRGSGAGGALLRRLAATAVQRGYARVEWSVLDWNAPSIAFYRSLGAVPMDGWSTFRLSGAALDRTASGTARSTRSPIG
ncbi:GNAT family N-acetyltransferase [Nakamurella flavida]|uniref:GNAT family N-acetyltransferase n=1 Tax=Nakamurella flavida TaxID=363630 RepID=A0A938YPJ2_9ACTN|nr:GNAT family N-acetyltransferase [Nakamurella flavida]MBM9477019.1 GNAT family N-acetyltransferase [Nakamurella flavida]MDP9779964.1 GNAT superfamily N-acetyltransferase [Nakamurella flavida]